jgi:hypothetical protein
VERPFEIRNRAFQPPTCGHGHWRFAGTDYKRKATKWLPVERAFGRAKHEWGLLPLRVRGIERVKLHVDLTVLAQLACALSKARSSALATAA